MSFAAPAWLVALLILPVLAGIEALASRRDRERMARFVGRPLWVRVVRRPGPLSRRVRSALLLVGAAGLVLALARPQWGIVREKVEREGVDVALVLDTSGSMATEDVSPNRFFLARSALMNLVSRLEGDRFGLVAFQGEAYPLVPLTLDADAVGLFLESLEPGAVPAPGTSLGVGLARGLELFVEADRRNKVLVLISDGEDLEGEIESAVRQAKAAKVVVYTVGVGTETGAPVPDFDKEGKRVGFKRDENGAIVVSRLHPETLETIAAGTGGRFFRVSSADTSLNPLATAIESMEEKSVAREFTYRRKEHFQIPLGLALLSFTLALLPLLPRLKVSTALKGAPRAACLVLVLASLPADAGVLYEVLLRPRRLTSAGRRQYEAGNDPLALQSFERAAQTRPEDPRARFNLADGLYKNGKFAEAGALYLALGANPASPLAAPARFNLGNARFQAKDFKGAVGAYRDALKVLPGDPDTRQNLELALRALEREQKDPPKQEAPKGGAPKEDPKQNPSSGRRGEEEKERQRFQKEAGMPKDRAMQLLDALQQDEKAQQRKMLLARPSPKPKGWVKDW
jgi:Ca-activated chloride channel family protein